MVVGQFESAARYSRLIHPTTGRERVENRENCPNCGHHVGAPTGYHGNEAMTMHSNTDCEGCGKPLIWFTDSDALEPGWRIDDARERRNKRAEGA